jgi:hypothetical protein
VPARFKKPVFPDTFVKHLIADEYGNVFYLMGERRSSGTKNQRVFLQTYFSGKQEWDIADFISNPEP